MSEQDKLSPRQVYHRVWELVQANFWFRERLGNWSEWEHKFDGELVTDADALRCATVMVESLNEAYTQVLASQPDEDEVETPKPCCTADYMAGRIGYIDVHTFSGDRVAVDIREAMESIQDAVAFVVDLRNNSGGSIARANKALSLFMAEGATYIFKVRRTDEGYLEAHCRIEATQFAENTTYAQRADVEYETWDRYDNLTGNRPMVVLINGKTGSASEFFAAVLRDNNRAHLLGTKTGGKGIAQDTIEVGNGFKLQITNGVFLPPSGQWFGDHGQTVKDGVEPHSTVLHNGENDNQLVAALAHLTETLSRQARCDGTTQSALEVTLAAA